NDVRTPSIHGWGAITRPGRAPDRDERHGCQAEQKAADGGEERDAAAGLRVQDLEAALPELEQEPDAEEPDRRDLPDEDEEEDERGEDARPRQEQQVGAEHAGDRTARADVRDA